MTSVLQFYGNLRMGVNVSISIFQMGVDVSHTRENIMFSQTYNPYFVDYSLYFKP